MKNTKESRLEAAKRVLAGNGLEPEVNQRLIETFNNLFNAQEECLKLSELQSERGKKTGSVEDYALDAAKSIDDAIVALAIASGGAMTDGVYPLGNGLAVRIGVEGKHNAEQIQGLTMKRKN